MGKRLGVAGTAIALVALAVGTISPAWGSAGDKDKQTTFRVDAPTAEQQFEGTDLGDPIVFTIQLLKGDTEVGHQRCCGRRNDQEMMAAGSLAWAAAPPREPDRTLLRLEARESEGPDGSSARYRLFNQHDSRQEPLEVGWRPEDTGWA